MGSIPRIQVVHIHYNPLFDPMNLLMTVSGKQVRSRRSNLDQLKHVVVLIGEVQFDLNEVIFKFML
jgi:hypothetical protein